MKHKSDKFVTKAKEPQRENMRPSEKRLFKVYSGKKIKPLFVTTTEN